VFIVVEESVMPVLSRCPLCRAVMPDSRGEARCPRCGELVLPAVRKLCVTCGHDITREKRVRDEAGEYSCHGCWEARLAARGEEPGYVCRTCGRVFLSDQVYQDGDEVICHGCYDVRSVDPNALLDAAAEAGDVETAAYSPVFSARRPVGPPWDLITWGIVVLVVTVGAIVFVSIR
jgi:ribosomal protein L37E